MKKLVRNLFDIKLFKGKSREELVLEIAEQTFKTLTESSLKGEFLKPTELVTVSEYVNKAVFDFILRQKIEKEKELENINKALEKKI